MGWVSGATGTADAANIGRALCSGQSVAGPCAVRSLSPAQLERVAGWATSASSPVRPQPDVPCGGSAATCWPLPRV